jgi:hypothetical protein
MLLLATNLFASPDTYSWVLLCPVNNILDLQESIGWRVVFSSFSYDDYDANFESPLFLLPFNGPNSKCRAILYYKSYTLVQELSPLRRIDTFQCGTGIPSTSALGGVQQKAQ